MSSESKYIGVELESTKVIDTRSGSLAVGSILTIKEVLHSIYDSMYGVVLVSSSGVEYVWDFSDDTSVHDMITKKFARTNK